MDRRSFFDPGQRYFLTAYKGALYKEAPFLFD